MEMAGIFCIIEVFFSQTFLFIGMCRFSAAFATDLSINLNDLGEKVLAMDGKSTPNSRTKLKPKFKDLLQFQSDTKS